MAVQVGVGLVEAAQLGQGDRAPGVRLGQEVQVAEAPGDVDQLVGHLQPPLLLPRTPVRTARPTARRPAPPGRRPGGPCRPPRGRAWAAAPRSRRSSRAPRPGALHAGAERRVLVGEHRQRLLEQRDAGRVLGPVLLPGAAGVAERGLGEQRRRLGLARRVGGAREVLAASSQWPASQSERPAGAAAARARPRRPARRARARRARRATGRRPRRRPAAPRPARPRAGSRRRRGRPRPGPAAAKWRASSTNQGSRWSRWRASIASPIRRWKRARRVAVRSSSSVVRSSAWANE